jgi:hypothetical protein
MHCDREEHEVKVLVTAATRYGATGEIAQAIGDVLSERGLTILNRSPGRGHGGCCPRQLRPSMVCRPRTAAAGGRPQGRP